MSKFRDSMVTEQIRWRRKNLENQERGKQNAGYYDHVLPYSEWQHNLWPEIAGDSPGTLNHYLKTERIRRHTGVHNLLSSWILCASLYFPFRSSNNKDLLAGFLRMNVSRNIRAVTNVELEHAFSQDNLTPATLLGETDGGRGAGQTSPDVAIEVETDDGPGVVLVECKFTEHNFYPCSGRKTKPGGRPPNPDKSRCLNLIKVINNPSDQCHLETWNRRYWDHLKPIIDSDFASNLKCCPAVFGGYQLFRQHSLAEGLANSGEFALVVSAIAYDERNTGLMKCMARSTGISEIADDWPRLFQGKASFTVFSHQSWVRWVGIQDKNDSWSNWLRYITGRYGIK